ncbi:hypothetical protein C8J57DRAFT_1222762 [Mycena rebaudengoi]|nr:hypothetical protein C8J57DRAFT_1222762 [Mycena rebaudengoi]
MGSGAGASALMRPIFAGVAVCVGKMVEDIGSRLNGAMQRCSLSLEKVVGKVWNGVGVFSRNVETRAAQLGGTDMEGKWCYAPQANSAVAMCVRSRVGLTGNARRAYVPPTREMSNMMAEGEQFNQRARAGPRAADAWGSEDWQQEHK